MPINIFLTFVLGGIIGWIVVKIMRPKPHLEGLIIATCASGTCFFFSFNKLIAC